MELESGFIVEPGLDGDITGPELLHRSEKGFAEIWRVQKFGQFVVLKALKPELRDDPVYEALLRKEFEIGYGLNHPSICRTWHYRRHPELGNCIEMEWVDGVTLTERFQEGRPDDALFRKIASELCDAVAYLHSRQVIHRDIKPSNILITHNGDNVKLIDFGLADSDDSAILKMPAGTETWLAPEVKAGAQADARTDIWALGCVLAALLGAGRSGSGVGSADLDAGRGVVCSRTLSYGRYARVLRKACAECPEDRYQHIVEFRRDLLQSPSRAWKYIVAALALALLGVGVAFWSRQDRPVMQEMSPRDSLILAPNDEDLPAGPDVDVVEIPSPPARSDKKTHPRENPSASREDVDALFRQATDLFE